VLENNFYASTTGFAESHAFGTESLVRAYGIPYRSVNGQDVEAVYEAAGDLLEGVRAGRGPAFLEARTYRFKGHYVGDPERYRKREEAQGFPDPLALYRERLLGMGVPEPTLKALEAAEEATLDQAVGFAEASPWPDAAQALEDLFAEPVRDYPWEGA
jgi:TPP-dependent pyruvate/acetoin dehydrogenase alpha subunit